MPFLAQKGTNLQTEEEEEKEEEEEEKEEEGTQQVPTKCGEWRQEHWQFDVFIDVHLAMAPMAHIYWCKMDGLGL